MTIDLKLPENRSGTLNRPVRVLINMLNATVEFNVFERMLKTVRATKQ